jgi:hypothetical protein
MSSVTLQLTWYQSHIAFHSHINPDPSPIMRGEGDHSSLLRSSKISVSTFTNNSSLALIPHPSSHLSSLMSLLRSAHYMHLTSTCTVINKATIDTFNSCYLFDPIRHALVYKPVAKKVRSVPTVTPSEYHVVRELPPEPLIGISPLPAHPPDFIPGIHFMQARADKLNLDPAKWLWPEELKLVRWLI